MTLTVGSRLGPYEVTAQIGMGGMGEVYRAVDTSLGRQVAIKVLPDAFAQDPERLARFEREAKTLAALNHPNIAQIYGLETSSGVRALVMELVEGDDLSQRIARGPIPPHETVPIAKQICDALETAHDQGIIHRDLKPANIKVRPDGTVKVLDFGLAKLAAGRSQQAAGSSQHAAGTSHPSMSPTITSPAMMTGAGVLLGTAAYMSPEQAKGREADKRSDIWAFGCVLYEMLTGTRPFHGEDVADTLAAILMREPDWAALPATTPPAIHTLLRSCFVKDRRQRIADISVAQFVLREYANIADAKPSTGRAETSPPGSHERFAWAALASLLFLALVATAFTPSSNSERQNTGAPAYRTTLSLATASNTPITGLGTASVDQPLALSPDGRRLAFVAPGPTGARVLWVRRLDSLSAQPLPDTDNVRTPFWSPDSESIGFLAGTALKKVDADGGPPVTLCDSCADGAGGTWNLDGLIVFSSGGALQRIPASGGVPSLVAEGDTLYRWPVFLPDGRHILYRGAEGRTYVRSIDSNDEKLVGAGGNAQYSDGWLVFVRGTTLLAQPFDLSRLELAGEPVPIAEQVRGTANGATFSVSQTGALVYQTGNALSQFTWYARTGEPGSALGDPGIFQTMALAPDGRRLVYGRRPPGGVAQSLWITDISRGVTTRLTFGDSLDADGAWSPDMSRLMYNSTRKGDKSLYEVGAGGGVERVALRSDGAAISVDDWSPDGRFVLFHTDRTRELWALPLDGDRKQFSVIKPRSGQIDETSFSPDGKWITYNSNESGRYEVYLSPFPSTGARWQVSSGGGVQPTWRQDGRELYFLALDGAMMAVDVRLSTSPQLGTPQSLFRTKLLPSSQTDQYAPSPDGQKFLIMDPLADSDAPPTLVVNWPSLLRP